MKPYGVTRATIANPIYWLAVGALTAGQFMGTDVPWWGIVLAMVGIAALTYSIDRWYVQPRTAEAVLKRHFEKVMRESRPGARFLNDPTDVCEHGNPYYCGFCGGPVPR